MGPANSRYDWSSPQIMWSHSDNIIMSSSRFAQSSKNWIPTTQTPVQTRVRTEDPIKRIWSDPDSIWRDHHIGRVVPAPYPCDPATMAEWLRRQLFELIRINHDHVQYLSIQKSQWFVPKKNILQFIHTVVSHTIYNHIYYFSSRTTLSIFCG